MSAQGKKGRIALILCLSLLLLWPAGAWQGAGAQPGAESLETLSVVMVIDISNSMGRTDPEMLRETAAHIFIDLLGPEDTLGIITFDHEVETVLPMQQVGGAGSRENIKNTLSARLTPRGHTDFLQALATAYDKLQAGTAGGSRPVVLFLTDGEPSMPGFVDDPGAVEPYMNSLWETVSRLALQGYPVYSIAFSEDIDPDIIRRISQDTAGDYYILEDAAPLVESSFNLLGTLKNRRGFLQETVTLGADPRAFDLQVGEYTRQVNLVGVNQAGGQMNLEIMPPPGEAADGVDINILEQDNYSLAVLSFPGEGEQGDWQAAFSGSGQVDIMGDMDLFIKAWLEEPAPFSQHPLGEPMQLKASISGGDMLADLPLSMEAEVKMPDERASHVVALTEEDGFFTGTFAEVNQQGTYEILTNVKLEGEIISSSSARINVRRLPSVVTEFWLEESYRLGEEVIVSTSLQVDGQRMPEGPQLTVNAFNLVLDYAGEENIDLPLYDSGSEEHGDIRAGDGIWSNRLTLEKMGEASARLQVAGEYRGNDFFLEKSLGELEVRQPGKMLVDYPSGNLWSTPGGELTFDLQVTSESSFTETLLLDWDRNLGALSPARITLDPGESRRVQLTFSFLDSLELKEYPLSLDIRADNPLTEVEAPGEDLAVELLGGRDAFMRGFFNRIVVAGSLLLLALVIFLVIYVGGSILYRFLVYPQTIVSGTLSYRKRYDEEGREDLAGAARTLKLHKVRKDTVVISFDPNNKNADFVIEGSEFTYDLILRTYAENSRRHFVQGWKALRQRNFNIITVARCSRPGILEQGGQVFSEKELFHGEEFDSGDFSFQYHNPYGRWHKEQGDGIDVLGGKINI